MNVNEIQILESEDESPTIEENIESEKISPEIPIFESIHVIQQPKNINEIQISDDDEDDNSYNHEANQASESISYLSRIAMNPNAMQISDDDLNESSLPNTIPLPMKPTKPTKPDIPSQFKRKFVPLPIPVKPLAYTPQPRNIANVNMPIRGMTNTPQYLSQMNNNTTSIQQLQQPQYNQIQTQPTRNQNPYQNGQQRNLNPQVPFKHPPNKYNNNPKQVFDIISYQNQQNDLQNQTPRPNFKKAYPGVYQNQNAYNVGVGRSQSYSGGVQCVGGGPVRDVNNDKGEFLGYRHDSKNPENLYTLTHTNKNEIIMSDEE